MTLPGRRYVYDQDAAREELSKAENSIYFDAIIADRANQIDDETVGGTLVSIETTELAEESEFYTYLRNNFAQAMRLMRYLDKDEQELLLCYYILRKYR